MPKVLAIALLLGALALSAPAEDLAAPGKLVLPQAGASVVMDNIDGRPLVEVMINGKGPYQFILDTGADISVIDTGLQEQLLLPQTKASEEVRNASGSDSLVLAELRLGDAVLTDTKLAVAPISRMFHTAKKPVGVLSAASFPGYLLILDYPAQRVAVRNGELVADGRRVFQYEEKDILPTVTLRIGTQQIRAHIDAGSPGGVTVPTRFTELLPLSGKPEKLGIARTPHGDSVVMKASLAEPFELGEYRLGVTEVHLADLQAGEVSGMGNIGAKVLHDFVVTIDARNHRIKLDR